MKAAAASIIAGAGLLAACLLLLLAPLRAAKEHLQSLGEARGGH